LGGYFIQQGYIKLIKSGSENIYSNVFFKQYTMFSTKILGSKTVCNIENIQDYVE